MLRSCRNTYFSILIDILYSADCLLHHRWTRRSPASSSPIRSAMGNDLGQHSTATLWNKLSRPRSTPLSTGYSVENATFTSAIALTRAPDGMTRGGHGFDHDFLAVCAGPLGVNRQLEGEVPSSTRPRSTPQPHSLLHITAESCPSSRLTHVIDIVKRVAVGGRTRRIRR